MGYWWLILAGVAWVSTLIALLARPMDATGCPDCGHGCGLNGDHCGEAEDYSGWVSDTCLCENDYHRHYEPVG